MKKNIVNIIIIAALIIVGIWVVLENINKKSSETASTDHLLIDESNNKTDDKLNESTADQNKDQTKDSTNQNKEHSKKQITKSFKLKTFETEEDFTLHLANDKPMVFVFFTSWCPYCNEDAPKLVELYEKYKDQIDVYGINIVNRDDLDDVRDYIEEHGIEYPILLDMEGEMYKEYRSPGFPSLFFYSKEGKLTNKILGATKKERIEKAFVKAIEAE